MKRILLYGFLISSCLAFSQKMEGVIENTSIETKIILKTFASKFVKEIKVKKGKFKTTNLNLKEGYYTLRKDNETIYLYLKPTDDFTILFDDKKFLNTVEFSGEGSEKNNYLIEKRRLQIDRTKDAENFYKGTETDYLRKIKKLKTDVLELLRENKLEEGFIQVEKENLRYAYLFDVLNFENIQSFYFGKTHISSKEYLKPLNSINFDNEVLYNTYPSYKRLSSLRWKEEIKKAASFTEKEMIFTSIKSNSLKMDVLKSFYFSISRSKNKGEDYFKLIKKYVPNQKFVAMAKKQLKNVKRTGEGNKSPSFKYKDMHGEEVSLKDFKGKYVLIDVWATWCMPCLKQFPYLKKLEHKYENKNIVFIGISVDRKKEYNLWKETVLSKELKSVQLFADNSFDSKFIKAYAIASIPRFILISPEGKIIDSNMSKPSEEQTENFLDNLLE